MNEEMFPKSKNKVTDIAKAFGANQEMARTCNFSQRSLTPEEEKQHFDWLKLLGIPQLRKMLENISSKNPPLAPAA